MRGRIAASALEPRHNGSMLEPHADGVVVEVWVVAGASRTEIAGIHDGALRVRVAAPPAGGAANEAAAKLLKGIFDSRVQLVSGASRRRKRFLVNMPPADARRVVDALGIRGAS